MQLGDGSWQRNIFALYGNGENYQAFDGPDDVFGHGGARQVLKLVGEYEPLFIQDSPSAVIGSPESCRILPGFITR